MYNFAYRLYCQWSKAKIQNGKNSIVLGVTFNKWYELITMLITAMNCMSPSLLIICEILSTLQEYMCVRELLDGGNWDACLDRRCLKPVNWAVAYYWKFDLLPENDPDLTLYV